ncbi:MAG TPA: tRNA (guanosine(46)-N7)-methyltransferase TrmB [Actinoplanes sp.]|nr:tRNA (guanosine(46)-N7)-methyltransferase TrmB [Actinoplanes sp.]
MTADPTATRTDRPIRTFHPRRGRLSTRHAEATAGLWPRFGVTVTDGDRTPLDLDVLFGRVAPRVLEIGFGMGEATAAMAVADPGRDYLGIEVHTPGVGNLLAYVGDFGLTNVRVAVGDAMQLLHRLAPASLDAVHVYFPDPWPKARHHKRRLIQPANVALLCERLRPGATLHCATDWAHYAQAMATVLDAEPRLANLYDGFAPRPEHRPVTKFEARAVRAGREIFDLIYRRSS